MHDRTPAGFAVLTAGFGTTVAMWAVGYLCRLPSAHGISAVPGWALLALLVVCLLGGGLVLGRVARLGFVPGAAAGAISATVNLLILGSVLTGDEPNAVVPSALLWIPGSFVASMVLMGIGAAAGARSGAGGDRPAPDAGDWRTAFAAIALVATLLVVFAGGLVTSLEAGLAVPDWPNSFGSNMFLYPLAKMTGGIYYEHAHRLYGSLVGLTIIVLACVVWRTDARRSIRILAVALVGMVVLQGVLGGLRVDRSLSFSTDPAFTEPNLALAIVHGIFGQIVLATIGVLWAMSTRTWRGVAPTAPASADVSALHGGSGRTLALATPVLLLGQLVFGTLYRHLFTVEARMPWPAHVHLLLAAIVAVVVVMVGMTLWGCGGLYRRLGATLLALVGVQLVLGVAALVVLLLREGDPGAAEVVFTTAHQVNGALVFVVGVQIGVWTLREPRATRDPSWRGADAVEAA